MNIWIYSACKKSTNIKTNEYAGPNILEYIGKGAGGGGGVKSEEPGS